MDKLITSLDTNLGSVLREQLDTNFQKIQNGVDGQSDDLNKQITDLLGDVAPQDQNEVTQARIDVHGNPYGTLKSREDATQATAETALSEERDTSVEVQDARTNSSSKTYPTLKERLDNQENDLNNSINDKLAAMRLNPEAFANEAALRAKYPQGNDQLNVTTDNGHLWIWTNGNFKDCGQFQTAGIDQVLVDQIKEAFEKVNRLPNLIDGQPIPSDTVISTTKYIGQEWFKMTSTSTAKYRGLNLCIKSPDKISAMATYPVKINFNIQSSIDQTLGLDIHFLDINDQDMHNNINIDNIALNASEILNYQKEFSLDSSQIKGVTKVVLGLYTPGTNDLGTILINNHSVVLEYDTNEMLNPLPNLIDGQPIPSDTVISTTKYIGQEWLKMTSTSTAKYRGLNLCIKSPDKISAMATYPVKINFNIQSSIDQTLGLDIHFFDINDQDMHNNINIDNIALNASEILNYQKEFSLDSSQIKGVTKVVLGLYTPGTNDLGTILINNHSVVLEYDTNEMSGTNASDNTEGYYNLPIIKINGELAGMSQDNAKQVTYEYCNGGTVLTGCAKLKWQGNSSLGWSKKGYRLQPFTDNTFAEKEKVRFIPSWSPTSKINLKAYYTDGLLSRDVVNANIGADITSTNLSLPNDLKQEDNFGFIDGFPIVLIFNNKFEGIYSFNTARSDFSYTKYGIMGNGYSNVTNFTSANKTDVKLDGSDFESLNPETVTDDEKSAVGDLVTWVATSSDDSFKADFEKHLDLKTTIDYFIIVNLLASVDSFGKNQIFLTWDGVKWFMQMYDLDTTFGISWDGKTQDLPTGLIGTQNNLFKRLAQLFNSEISARYTELRAWLTPAYVLDKYKKRVNEIGVGNYKLEFAKWNNPTKDIATYKQLKGAALHQFSLLDQIWLKK